MIQRVGVVLAFSVGLYGVMHCYKVQQHDKFVAQMKSNFSGYRIEHFEHERLLFLHEPNKKPDGIDLARVRRVLLWKLVASEAADGRTRYSWVIENNDQSFSVPFFAIEPSSMLKILKVEIPEIDANKALKRSSEFERDAFIFCTVWASPSDERAYGGNNGTNGSCAP